MRLRKPDVARRPGFCAFGTGVLQPLRKVQDQWLELVQLAVKEVPGARPARAGAAFLDAAAPRPRRAPRRRAPHRPHRPAPASSRNPDGPRCRARSAPPAAPRPRASRAPELCAPRSATKAPNENPPNHNAAPGKRRRPSATTAARSSVSPRPLSNLPALAPDAAEVEAEGRRAALHHRRAPGRA